jgi:hypothetical protein
MEVQLSYSVPVLVTVDTEAQEVTRVEVLDESVQLSRVYDDAAEELTKKEREALDIAETSDWPAWEF